MYETGIVVSPFWLVSVDDHSAGKVRDGSGHSARFFGGEEDRDVRQFRKRARPLSVSHAFDERPELLPRDTHRFGV